MVNIKLLFIIINEGKNKKIASVVIGLVVMLTVMKPIAHITEITQNHNFPTFTIEESYKNYDKNMVSDVFEENLATAIKEKVSEKFEKDINCKVSTARNENGEITKIESVEISSSDDDIINFIKTEFALSEITSKGDTNG